MCRGLSLIASPAACRLLRLREGVVSGALSAVCSICWREVGLSADPERPFPEASVAEAAALSLSLSFSACVGGVLFFSSLVVLSHTPNQVARRDTAVQPPIPSTAPLRPKQPVRRESLHRDFVMLSPPTSLLLLYTRAHGDQVVSTFVGDMRAKEKNVDQLQYQMMISSQIMPYDEEQVRPFVLLFGSDAPPPPAPPLKAKHLLTKAFVYLDSRRRLSMHGRAGGVHGCAASPLRQFREEPFL